jgi:hypothetical protein
MLRYLTRTALVLMSALLITSFALAHDSWISRGGLKNAAGEWCCGEGDCFVIPGDQVAYGIGTVASVGTQGDIVWGYTLFGVEFVPESETMLSPDGAFWRCKRPDGSRRCFFAPPPGS